MPVYQICPKCHQPFIGSDAIGKPCLACEIYDNLNKRDYKEIIEDYLFICDELRKIAQKYGDAVLNWKCVVTDIRIDKDMFFRFNYESTTPGIRFYGRLPVSLLERPESDLLEIIERDKIKREEEIKRSTCQTCGHIKYDQLRIYETY